MTMRASPIRTTLATAALALLALGTAQAQQQGVTDTEILLGDILPLTGPPALLGAAHNLGVKIAIAEANAAGGINGRKLRLISEDDGYVVSRTLQGVRKLVTSDKVFALTSLSGTRRARRRCRWCANWVCPPSRPSASTRSCTSRCRRTSSPSAVTTRWVPRRWSTALADKFPGKKWAIVSQNDEYGEKVREGFEEVVKAKKLNVVSQQIYKKGQVDFSSEMLKVKQAGAEILFAGGVLGENAAMAKELERQGHKIPFGTTYVSRVNALLGLMGTAAENLHSVDFVALEDTPRGTAMMDLAKKHLTDDEFKKVNRYTFTGYAGAKTMFEAFKRCGKALTWDCTIKQMDGLKDFDTGVTTPGVVLADEPLRRPAFTFVKADLAAKKFVPAN
jgi:branched-chain amino acid transport system substrate-binding protein